MKRYIMSACVIMSLVGHSPAFAEPLKVGFSLDTKESTLETAWETFLKSEGEVQGKAAGYEFQWTINVANADPARQAANIDDLLGPVNRGALQGHGRNRIVAAKRVRDVPP